MEKRPEIARKVVKTKAEINEFIKGMRIVSIWEDRTCWNMYGKIWSEHWEEIQSRPEDASNDISLGNDGGRGEIIQR